MITPKPTAAVSDCSRSPETAAFLCSQRRPQGLIALLPEVDCL